MNTLRASKGITSSGKTFWLIPAIRKKERNGPGIVRFADSGDPALASSDGKESAGTVHRAAGAGHQPREKGTPKMQGRREKGLAHRPGSKRGKRSVQGFKNFSPKRGRSSKD